MLFRFIYEGEDKDVGLVFSRHPCDHQGESSVGVFRDRGERLDEKDYEGETLQARKFLNSMTTNA